jgi:hypothetical protein
MNLPRAPYGGNSDESPGCGKRAVIFDRLVSTASIQSRPINAETSMNQCQLQGTGFDNLNGDKGREAAMGTTETGLRQRSIRYWVKSQKSGHSRASVAFDLFFASTMDRLNKVH